MTVAEWAVTTWNLQGAKPTDLTRAAEVIESTLADVVTLQEIRRPQAERLAADLDMRYTWAFKHHALTPVRRSRAEGAAILTPHRLTDADHAVISRNRSPRSFKRRIALWASVHRRSELDSGSLWVIDVHLSPHDRHEQRLDEAGVVNRLALRHAGSNPVVVAGDFNDDLQGDVMAALPGLEHVPVLPAHPSEAPDRFLDHVLLPTPARDVSVSVPGGGPEWAALSDHLPVTVRFTLPDTESRAAPADRLHE